MFEGIEDMSQLGKELSDMARYQGWHFDSQGNPTKMFLMDGHIRPQMTLLKVIVFPKGVLGFGKIGSGINARIMLNGRNSLIHINFLGRK